MRFVEQQFFPTSDRTEIVIDINERANASIAKTNASIAKLEAMLAEQPDALFWTSYIGHGAPRFVLSMEVLTPGPYMGQMVIQTPDLVARDRLKARIVEFGQQELIGTDLYVKNLEIGPPVGKPVQYRVSSPDLNQARDTARDLAALLATEPRLRDITLDWNEPARVVRLLVNQDQARQLGITSEDISASLAATFTGRRITQIRDGIFLINVVARGTEADRSTVDSIQNLQLATPTGTPIPLAALAKLEYGTEQLADHATRQHPDRHRQGRHRGH